MQRGGLMAVTLGFKRWLIRQLPSIYLVGKCDPSLQRDFSWENLRYVECDKSSLSVFCMRRLVPIVRTSPFPLDELLLMAASVVFFRPRLIIDWGTHIGASARVFYETCRWYKVDAEIHSIDLPEDVDHPQHPREIYALLLRNTSVRLHRGDGVTVAVGLIKERGDPAPLCMLDGDHSYETVTRELAAISEIAPMATILVHDTFHQEGRNQSGAYSAVKDFVSSCRKIHQIIDSNIGPPGLTLIKLCNQQLTSWT